MVDLNPRILVLIQIKGPKDCAEIDHRLTEDNPHDFPGILPIGYLNALREAGMDWLNEHARELLEREEKEEAETAAELAEEKARGQ